MDSIQNIKKRDGRIVQFDSSKIETAIWKAAESVGGTDPEIAKKITTQVKTVLDVLFKDPQNPPTVEQIQDLVEKILIEGGHAKTAKAYILYRDQRRKQRNYNETLFGKHDSNAMLNFSPQAVQILQESFLHTDSSGEFPETPADMVKRVVKSIANTDQTSDAPQEKDFYEAIKNLEFIPSPAILRNAGTSTPQLSDNFVIPLEDSIKGIFSTLREAAIIYKNGGAIGINFSKLRPNTDQVKNKPSVSSGPTSFIELFTTATRIIKKGVPQLPQNMITIQVNHPNILDFLAITEDPNQRKDCHFTVAITDDFITALENNSNYSLINPRNNSSEKSIPAKQVFDAIITNIWKHSSPQIIFLDNSHTEKTITPNNQLLLPYETVHSGAINISAFLNNETQINWEKLKNTVQTAIVFLEQTIDAHQYITEEIAEATKKSRKIELNIIGIQEFLNRTNQKITDLSFQSTIEEAIQFIQKAAEEKSKALALDHGQISNELRHTTLTTLRPDPLLNQIANLEPLKLEEYSLQQQLEFFTKLQPHLDGAFIPKIQLNQTVTIDHLKEIILHSHQHGTHGISFETHKPKPINIAVPPQIIESSRDHQPLTKAQEVIPPPMIELSRVVRETLEEN